MTVYHYDGVSREFLGTGTADVSPLEPGVYLIPANATTNQPPEPQEGYACVWDGKAWAQEEDHRGEQGYVNGIPRIITELGPLPDRWSDEYTVTDAERELRERAWRDDELAQVVARLDQFRNDQLFSTHSFPYTADGDAGAAATQLNAYRVALCEYPNQDAPPSEWARPEPPDFWSSTEDVSED